MYMGGSHERWQGPGTHGNRGYVRGHKIRGLLTWSFQPEVMYRADTPLIQSLPHTPDEGTRTQGRDGEKGVHRLDSSVVPRLHGRLTRLHTATRRPQPLVSGVR